MVELTLYFDTVGVLPAGVWQYVFPAGRKLPHLRDLNICTYQGLADPAPLSAWGEADISALVSCCPNLRKIPYLTLQHGSHVSELHKLTALTSLDLTYGTGGVAAVEESLKALADVTQLQKLNVSVVNQDLTVTNLLSLTSLTALSGFGFSCMRTLMRTT